MVKRHVRIYIEGGAVGGTADNDFRRGWKKFLNKFHDLARQNGYASLEIVRGKGRSDTFRRFCSYHVQYPSDLCVLLVDAEKIVPSGSKVWDIVKQREGDNWDRPDWATEEHLYLMVTFVETWLLTDHEALSKFFKQGFNQQSLPTTNLEARSKAEVEDALKRATKTCKNGPYRHGQAHKIIELMSPEKVQSLSHAKRLFESLSSLIKQKTR